MRRQSVKFTLALSRRNSVPRGNRQSHLRTRTVILTFLMCLTIAKAPRPAGAVPVSTRFEISFPASLRAQPITGRTFVAISKESSPEPRLQAGSWGDMPPLFGRDVNQLAPGQSAIIDAQTLGYPPRSLTEIPPGDYYVQALMNVYTEFHRADGHDIWAHMDRWEGQQFNRSPGNYYSRVLQVHLDPSRGYDVKITLDHI